MKIYDTDEAAIARGARRRTLARVLQWLLMLLLMLGGAWAVYTFVLAPNRDAAVLERPLSHMRTV